ncbi:MAG: hypothetical protein VST66_07635, partial [Nitrospirota bacterium]|nr:hypothetical protein [Nitrospirota bacterium]
MNPSGDLTVALPVGMFVGDAGIIHRRLDISRLVDGAGRDSVSARLRVLPIPMPKLPGKLMLLTTVDSSRGRPAS